MVYIASQPSQTNFSFKFYFFIIPLTFLVTLDLLWFFILNYDWSLKIKLWIYVFVFVVLVVYSKVSLLLDRLFYYFSKDNFQIIFTYILVNGPLDYQYCCCWKFIWYEFLLVFYLTCFMTVLKMIYDLENNDWCLRVLEN